jgi:hypothetical protein
MAGMVRCRASCRIDRRARQTKLVVKFELTKYTQGKEY